MSEVPALKIAFFGTPDIAVWILEELEKEHIVPSVVITNPDAPQGRKHVMTPPPVKVWAHTHNIPVIQPTTLEDATVASVLQREGYNLFVVAAYGKIIPKHILDVPPYGTLNVHPSLLPKLRGASPIRSALLTDTRETGVTIMLMDELLDHGPVLAKERADIPLQNWPMRGRELDELLARKGGRLLASVIPQWIAGELTPEEQDHAVTTLCAKITKEMGELDLNEDPYQNLLKIRAFDGWPGTFFFTEKNGVRMRVKITDAEMTPDGTLKITRVIPEGKKEVDYQDCIRNLS